MSNRVLECTGIRMFSKSQNVCTSLRKMQRVDLVRARSLADSPSPNELVKHFPSQAIVPGERARASCEQAVSKRCS